MPQPDVIKPNKSVFVYYRFGKQALLWLIIFSVVGAFLPWLFTYFIPVYIIISLLQWYSFHVQYRKASYEFHKDKIIQKYGGIFSDGEVELNVRNITLASHILPWLEHALFSTGSVYIQSAGSSSTEITLSNINNSRQMYEYVLKLMQYNGFKLTRKTLVQEEHPATIGALIETLSQLFGAVVFVAYFMIGIVGSRPEMLARFLPFIMFLVSVGIIGFVVHSVLKFLDLHQRVYCVYNDALTYSEGFLTKHYAVIPAENLADATVTQTFVDKILGLYDVKVSSQGAGNEILFKNMRNGLVLEKNIDKLASEFTALPTTPAKEAKTTVKTAKQVAPKSTTFTATYAMHTSRALFPLFVALPFCVIIFILLPMWVIGLIAQLIRVTNTSYHVKKDSVEQRYDFLTAKHVEFTNEKIMAIVVKESFIDKLFNTVTVTFWSIGSRDTITFQHVKKDAINITELTRKIGITPQDVIYKTAPEFSWALMVKAHFFTHIAFFTLMIVLVMGLMFSMFLIIPFIILAAMYVAQVLYRAYYHSRVTLTFYEDYLHFHEGVLFHDYYYVPYDNIKDILTTKYIATDAGSIQFDIAGEHAMGSEQQQRQGKVSFASNSASIHYIPNITVKDELIDLILEKRPNAKQVKHIEENIVQYSPEPLLTAKPHVLTGTIIPIIFFIIIFPLIPFIPFLIWAERVKTYAIQPYRVYYKYGIFYKSQQSIVFRKIDYITKDAGALNKLFGNGNITVNTAGSSSAELTIDNIPNYEEFYEAIRKRYKGS